MNSFMDLFLWGLQRKTARPDIGAVPGIFKIMPAESGERGRSSPSGIRGYFSKGKQIRYEPMAYVVTESCIKCKYTDCVDVCPVDCFREGPNMLVIDPDECIDCTLCVPECPVEAILAEDDVPDEQREFIAKNRELAKKWQPIIEKKPAPPDADEWAKVKEKDHLLEK